MKKTLGIILAVGGIMGGIYAMNLDTTVSVSSQYGGGSDERVNNIGKMNDKQNALFISGILFLAGAALGAGDTEDIENELSEINKKLTPEE